MKGRQNETCNVIFVQHLINNQDIVVKVVSVTDEGGGRRGGRCEGRIPSQATNVKTWCIDCQEIKPGILHTYTRTHTLAFNRSMGNRILQRGGALQTNKPYSCQAAVHLRISVDVCV